MNKPMWAIAVLALVLMAFPSRGISQVSNRDLVAYFPFDGDATDGSGNFNHGSLIGNVTKGADRFGNPCGALTFDGRNGYVEVPNSYTLQQPTSQFSLTTWFYIENATDPNMLWLTFVCKGASANETDNNPQYRVQVQQSSTSTISLNTEITENFSIYYTQKQWYFFAMVYDGRQIKAYLNNQLVFAYNYSRKLSVNNAPLHIGKDIPGSTEYFAGRLDEMRLYSRALSDSEIATLYNDQTRNQLSANPTSDLMPNITKKTDPGTCGAIVNYYEPQFSIGCGTVKATRVEGLGPGGTFPVGTSSVTYLGTTNGGASKSSHFYVTVADKEPPTIQCPKNQKLKAPPGATEYAVKYGDPVVTDNCKNSTTNLLQGFASGTDFPIGKTNVIYEATDAYGNKAQCSFEVDITSDVASPPKLPSLPTKPRITVSVSCQDDIALTVEPTATGQSVNYAQPQLIVNNVARSMSLTKGLRSGASFPVGITQVVYQGTDDTGGVHVCSFNVTITRKNAPAAPVINCPQDIAANCETGQNYATVYFGQPMAMEGSKPLAVKQIKGLPSGSQFTKGKHEIVFEATGSTGTKTTCSFFITVNCVDPPATAIVPPKRLDPKLNLGNDSVTYEPNSVTASTCQLTLYGYDGREYDGDTVSIIFNDQVLVNYVEIVRNTNNYKGIIRLNLQLIPGQPNVLILKAWNEGTRSTNTLMVELYEGDVPSKQVKNSKPLTEIELKAKPGFAKGLILYCN